MKTPIKAPFQELESGTFFTFETQADDLFMKTAEGMIRIPNIRFAYTSKWDNKHYMNTRNYIILTAEEVKGRLVQVADTFCKKCGHKL